MPPGPPPGLTPRLPGRPRAAQPRDGVTTREEILQASAHLFCTQGYGRTSTHAIARGARISQAALYHHFAGKHEVLLTLLLRTVRPSTDFADALLAASHQRDPHDDPQDSREGATARLRQLCAVDARLLASGPENVGLLYALPEVLDEQFAAFHAERRRLFAAYCSLVGAVMGAPADDPQVQRSAALVFGLVESVITRRLDGFGGLDDELPERVADAALQVLATRVAARG